MSDWLVMFKDVNTEAFIKAYDEAEKFETDISDRSKMRLYDVENTAQNIVDRGKQPETKEDPYDKFSDFKV